MALRLLYLIFRQLVAWLGLLARSSRSKNAEIPGAASRGCRAPSPGEQTATVLGRPRHLCGADPVAVPGRSPASDRHPRHSAALAPGPGGTALDPAPLASHRRPVHGIRARPAGTAPGRREPDLGIPEKPRRTDRKSTRLNSSHANISY